jgi:hypothetical protein
MESIIIARLLRFESNMKHNISIYNDRIDIRTA